MGERDAKQYHPPKKEMSKLVDLHQRLVSIAERKRTGVIDNDTAKRLAVTAIDALIGREPGPYDNGPLTRLHKLAANGWIMEASGEMPLLYPTLDHPEQWTDPTARRRRTSRRGRFRLR